MTLSGNNHQSLVCRGQQCDTTWRETWKWGCIARLLWMNCRMPTWMGAMTHAVLCCTSLKCHIQLRGSFSDECATYHSATDRILVFWSTKNPHFRHDLEYNPPHVMTSDYLIGPYCFSGPVDTAVYSAVVQLWLKPQLRYRGLVDDEWLQQDEAHTQTHTLLCTTF